MDLMSHSVASDNDFVNQFGGVAYDHDSLPKIAAVYTCTAEMPTSTITQGEAPNLPLMAQLHSKICCSMNIGMRGIPQTTQNTDSFKIWTSVKDNSDAKGSKLGNRFSQSSAGLENVNPSDLQRYNTVNANFAARGLLRTLLQEHSLKPAAGDMEYQSNIKQTLWGRDLANLFPMENFHFHKSSEAITEALPIDGRLRCCGFKSPGNNLSEAHVSANRNLEIFDWSTTGVGADLSIGHANFSHQTNSTSQLFNTKSLVPAGEGDHLLKEATNFNNSSNKAPTSASHLNSLGQCFAGGSQSFNMMDVRPRKRPRKSIPRKIDQKWQNSCRGSPNTDSEGTARSADEIPSLSPEEFVTPSESPAKCVPVNSFNYRSSPRSDEESSGGTKVLFRRTAGVWSVSPLHSCEEENNELQETLNKELTQSRDSTYGVQPPFGSGCNTQGGSVHVFSNRRIAPLVPYDPLVQPHNVEPCWSPALDREARIKELLSRQEKLLTEMRQKKSGN